MSIDIDNDVLDIQVVTTQNGQPRPAHPRITFPSRPGHIRDYVTLPDAAEPRVERRWYRYTISGMPPVDLLWFGTCLSCTRGLWAREDHSGHEAIPVNMALTIVERDGRQYRFCSVCASSSRVSAIIEAAANIFTGPYEWPSEVIETIRMDPERRRLKVLSEIVPVIPRMGSLLRPKVDGEVVGTRSDLLHFAGFEDGMVATTEGKTFACDAIEAFVPAFPGVTYERAVSMPCMNSAGTLVRITGWRVQAPLVQRTAGGTSTAWGSPQVAALAPVLDPSTETPEQTIERLERQQARLELGLQSRMVAEATARSWCSEFDIIIDATGLPPRQVKGVVSGTMTFSYTFDSPVSQATLDGIAARWQDYIPNSAITLTEVKLVSNEKQSLITPV